MLFLNRFCNGPEVRRLLIASTVSDAPFLDPGLAIFQVLVRDTLQDEILAKYLTKVSRKPVSSFRERQGLESLLLAFLMARGLLLPALRLVAWVGVCKREPT
jgi:hypothetical protein